MAVFSDLYKAYAEQSPLELNKVKELLTPYIEQFDIKFQEKSLTIGKIQQPINTILLDRICAVVDEPQEAYIVLEGCIYVLDKANGEVRVNIR